MFDSNAVAWWGAIVATIVLLWDILKWLKTGAKITPRIKLHGLYFPADKDNSESSIKNVCHIELINIGTMPTTILDIQLTHKKQKNSIQCYQTRDGFTFHQSLPYVIKQGEVWSCHIPLEDYVDFVNQGKPEFLLDISHKKTMTVFRPDNRINKLALKATQTDNE